MATASRKTAPKKPSSKPSSKPAAAPAKPTAKARAEYDALMAEVEDAELDTQRGWDRLWEATRNIVRKKLYLFEDDTPTAEAWVRKHTGELYRTANRNMTVAALSSPDEQRKYKVTRIGLAYAIDEAQREAVARKKKVDYVAPETPPKLDLDALRYSVERDEKTVKLALDEVTADELRGVLRSLRRKSKGAQPRLGPTAKRLVDRIGDDRKLDNVRVVEHGGELSLSGVRADQLGALGALLVALSRETE